MKFNCMVKHNGVYYKPGEEVQIETKKVEEPQKPKVSEPIKQQKNTKVK